MSDNPSPLYCANHPNVETGLRCNNCSKPICPKCAVLTPTGYRCRECLRSQQKVFETTVWYDYPLALGIAAILAFLGSLLASIMGFFTLFIAPIAGVIIAEATRWVIRRRRSERLFRFSAAAAAIGGFPLVLMLLISLLQGVGLMNIIWSLIWQIVYTVTVTSTLYYRLKGIRFQ